MMVFLKTTRFSFPLQCGGESHVNLSSVSLATMQASSNSIDLVVGVELLHEHGLHDDAEWEARVLDQVHEDMMFIKISARTMSLVAVYHFQDRYTRNIDRFTGDIGRYIGFSSSEI
jgi:hypothetical protein